MFKLNTERRCAQERIRTPDLIASNDPLYPLSYLGGGVEGTTGVTLAAPSI